MLSVIRTIAFLILSEAALRASFNLTTAPHVEVALAVCSAAALLLASYLLFKQRDRTDGSQLRRSFVAAGLGVSMVIASISMLVPLVEIAMT